MANTPQPNNKRVVMTVIGDCVVKAKTPNLEIVNKKR